jgi:2-aminoadipate transaminase
MQYGAVAGFGPLIDALVPRLHAAGVHTTGAGIHITAGATGAMHALCTLTLQPGARVLVAEPSYGVESGMFTAHGAHVEGLPCDASGIMPDALDAALRRAAAQFIYLTPTFANPTGVTMPAARRADIADIACRHRILLVEDDVYSPLRYSGPPQQAMHLYAPDHTVYIGSLSKTFAPAIRIGYVVAPAPLQSALTKLKEGIDMQTSTLAQAIAAQFLTTQFDIHLRRLRSRYAARLDAINDALVAEGLSGYTWHRPEGGMFLWLRGPCGFNVDDAWMKRAAAAGVNVMPGHHFYTRPDTGRHTMRLAFAPIPIERIRTGIHRLAKILPQRDAAIAI